MTKVPSSTELRLCTGQRGSSLATGTDSLADVNEAEGAVLGLLARAQPLSRYQILRFFQNSPARFQNVSKGSVYPLVARLVMVAPNARIAELRERITRLLADVQREFSCEDNAAVKGDDERWAMTITFAPTSHGRRG